LSSLFTIEIAENEGRYFMKYQDELFELGDKNEVKAKLKELFDKSDSEIKKWLDEFLEATELDKYINSQDFKFLKLGYRFTHTMWSS
jgi:hypothetical protein